MTYQPADFYPRSPCGERPTDMRQRLIELGFLSTLSLRRATKIVVSIGPYIIDFYPRSPCGERQVGQKRLRQKLAISIHALLAESDREREPASSQSSISIHALLAESDGIGLVFLWWGVRFLSTLSLRRATSIGNVINNIINDFYPRSPCGERLGC